MKAIEEYLERHSPSRMRDIQEGATIRGVALAEAFGEQPANQLAAILEALSDYTADPRPLAHAAPVEARAELVRTLFAGAITTLGEIARNDDKDGGFWGDAGDAAAIEGAQVGGRLIDRELDVRPSIRLRAGAPVRVMITRDLILEPYRP